MFTTHVKAGLRPHLPSRLVRLSLLAAATSALPLAVVSPINAATPTWIGGSGDFAVGSNWSSGVVPTSADNAYIHNTGAVVTVSSNLALGDFNIGNGAASDVVNITGGSSTSNYFYLNSHVGGGSLNMSGGTWTLNGSTAIVIGANVASGNVATFNLSGGTLIAPRIYVGQWTNASGVLNLTDAGILQAGLTGTADVTIGDNTSGVGVLNIGTGGAAGTLIAANIKSNGVGTLNFNHTNGVTVSASIQNGLVVNKLGSGVTTLTGANTYTGATTVSAGTLLASNATSSTGTAAVTVAHLATLGGTGRISGSVFNSGILAPGNLNAIGTLSVGGSVTWNGQAADAWQFDLGSSGTSDKLAITGNFLKGTGTQFVFDFVGGGSVGTYTLATFAASNFVSSNFTATNLAAGHSAAFTKSATALTVAITGSAVPEPSTYAVIAGAVILGVVVLRRRKMASAAI